MSTRLLRLAVIGLMAVAAGATAMVGDAQTPKPTGAPSPLAPFKASEAAVRTEILRSVEGGGEISNQLLVLIREGYDRIPPALRGAATTAAFAWAKSYVSSPAFVTAYAKYRDEHTPDIAAVSSDPIDVEVQKELARLIAELEEIKKGLTVLDSATRAGAVKNLDDQIARYKSPEHVRAMRIGLEAKRGSDTADNTRKAAEFAARWPADPKVYVRKQLERFMTTTEKIDYSLPTFWVKDSAGRTLGFLSPGMQEISTEAMYAIVAGKDAVDAARTAVGAWLKELP
jgi:hypothetical protein